MIRSRVIIALSALGLVSSSIAGCADVQGSARSQERTLTDTAEQGTQEDLDRWLDAAARSAAPGLFRFGAYDARKTAVVFINGIHGSPADFKWLISKLDLTTIQPWVFAYSSRKDLSESADQLYRSLCDQQLHYGPLMVTLVGYSIGGLIARDVALHADDESSCVRVPTLITLSTPWNGHHGAAWTFPFTAWLPAIWGDLIPGSSYLKHLFVGDSLEERTLTDTAHFLLFSYGRPPGFGRSGDGVVSVASQLYSDAQRQAVGVYGFNLSHDRMLQDAHVVRTVENLLEHPDENAQAAAF